MFPDFDVRPIFQLRRHGADDLLAGGVAEGMGDAVVAVAALAPRAKLLVLPSNRVPQAISSRIRSRPLADHALDDLGIAQRAARRQGVGHVIFAAIVGPHGAGDAALGVPAVGLPQPVLGDQQDRQLRIDGQGRPQSRPIRRR